MIGFDAYQHHNWRESGTLGTLTTAGATVRGDTPLVVSYAEMTERKDGVKCLNSWDCQSKRQYDIGGVYCTLYAGNSAGGQDHGVVYCLQGNGIERSDTAGCDGKGWREKECYTLNTIDRPAVVYGIDPLSSNSMKSSNPNSGFHEMNVAKCLDTSDGNPGKNQGGMCVVYDTTQITSPMNYSNPKPGYPCHPLAAQQHPPLAVYPPITGALCANSHPGSYTGQDAFNGMLPVIKVDKPPRKYIVRRLTPLECCRLQGFPDWWEDGVEGSDSARYKMWGNGIALPCAVDVLGRIAKEHRRCEE